MGIGVSVNKSSAAVFNDTVNDLKNSIKSNCKSDINTQQTIKISKIHSHNCAKAEITKISNNADINSTFNCIQETDNSADIANSFVNKLQSEMKSKGESIGVAVAVDASTTNTTNFVDNHIENEIIQECMSSLGTSQVIEIEDVHVYCAPGGISTINDIKNSAVIDTLVTCDQYGSNVSDVGNIFDNFQEYKTSSEAFGIDFVGMILAGMVPLVCIAIACVGLAFVVKGVVTNTDVLKSVNKAIEKADAFGKKKTLRRSFGKEGIESIEKSVIEKMTPGQKFILAISIIIIIFSVIGGVLGLLWTMGIFTPVIIEHTIKNTEVPNFTQLNHILLPFTTKKDGTVVNCENVNNDSPLSDKVACKKFTDCTCDTKIIDTLFENNIENNEINYDNNINLRKGSIIILNGQTDNNNGVYKVTSVDENTKKATIIKEPRYDNLIENLNFKLKSGPKQNTTWKYNNSLRKFQQVSNECIEACQDYEQNMIGFFNSQRKNILFNSHDPITMDDCVNICNDTSQLKNEDKKINLLSNALSDDKKECKTFQVIRDKLGNVESCRFFNIIPTKNDKDEYINAYKVDKKMNIENYTKKDQEE